MSPQATEGGNARPTTIDRMVETLRAGAETRRWIDLADLTDAFSDDEIVAHGPEAFARAVSPTELAPALTRDPVDALVERITAEIGHRLKARMRKAVPA
ncbi:MAG: hypothetical protein CML67_01970 [Rhodobacteraceae bacterium]|nr:hypothetical protein [Paracoccaceae bacterium]